MKLLGFRRVKGEKNGKSWDFVQLFVEREYVSGVPEAGGSQILTDFSKERGMSFPSIDYNTFYNLVKDGMKIGSEVNLYRDFDGHTILNLIK